MRTRRILAAAAALACASALVSAGARGGVTRGYRLLRANHTKVTQQPPAPYTTSADPCTIAGFDLSALPANLRPTDVFGSDFDPSRFDEYSVAGDGRLLAFATRNSDVGVPGAAKGVVIVSGVPGVAAVRVPAVGGGDNDQPAVQLDDFGYRCAFRSVASAGVSKIQLYTFTKAAGEEAPTTVAVTEGAGDAEFDPALAARTRVREIAAGVTVKERDARVAFVSTGDLDPGENPNGREQLFLWEEVGGVVRQITRHDDAAARVNRPAISKSGDVVVFESTADLDPGSVDPAFTARVGNPDHRRQLFRWRRGLRIDQITWGTDGNSFSPRMELNGRFVLFSSDADLTGGNHDAASGGNNREIFRWTAAAPPAERLTQLTQTTAGDSALPRPTLRPDVFVFYSTANLLPGESPAERQCLPRALLFERGRFLLVHGLTDLENAARLFAVPPKLPVLTGPPVPGFDARKVHFATNDPALNPRPPRGTPPSDAASPIAFWIGLATRYTRR